MNKEQEPATGDGQPETGNGQSTQKEAPTGGRRQEIGNGQPACRDPGATAELRIGADIADRLLNLAAAAIGVAKSVPRDIAGKHVADQLIRAATSTGANYEEARAAESRADFIHKVGIAAKEARETAYWLGVVHRSSISPVPPDVIMEAKELTAILGASARTARRAK